MFYCSCRCGFSICCVPTRLLLNLNPTSFLLLSLPFHVSCLQLVIDKLTRRALHSELSVKPCPHQVLFDFLLAWGNHKAAAAAMLSHARLLRAAAGAGGKQWRGAALQEAVDEVMAAYGERAFGGTGCCLHVVL
jgi:hypothetical protein